jgi:hypothetical protein
VARELPLSIASRTHVGTGLVSARLAGGDRNRELQKFASFGPSIDAATRGHRPGRQLGREAPGIWQQGWPDGCGRWHGIPRLDTCQRIHPAAPCTLGAPK